MEGCEELEPREELALSSSHNHMGYLYNLSAHLVVARCMTMYDLEEK